ncbi:hypothetical protein AB1Y20_020905 [Prymnesium parvum]|uniref:Derlin n=1 Tax=Prymnesium parvum TaxID=97485 RepID=A0AB34JJS9_PRYPA
MKPGWLLLVTAASPAAAWRLSRQPHPSRLSHQPHTSEPARSRSSTAANATSAGGSARRVLPRPCGRMLYLLSAVNPALAVLHNDYLRGVPVLLPRPASPKPPSSLARTYGTLFYFARLKPRVAFTIGAMLRGLQLTTAIQFVFDPVAGVGAGLNLMCLFAGSRWPAAVVLGWAATKQWWQFLGAYSPSSVPFPIRLSLSGRAKGFLSGIWQ